MYDYLVVGAGLFGSVFAHEATKRGRKVLVIDRRNHVGGNIYTKRQNGIDIHMYGPHIFHTSSKRIWDYVNEFCEMIPFTNAPLANFNGEIYNLPFNMNTFYQLWGTRTPAEAKAEIESQKQKYGVKGEPKNLEEQAVSMVGLDIYKLLVEGYTEKQWGKKCYELPASIIKRLPVRFTYDNNYFNDTYQGIPKDGYTALIEKLLEGVDVLLNVDYRHFLSEQDIGKIVYTGCIDEFFDYCFGELEFRCLKFEHEELWTDNYQGNAVVNYTDATTPYTRIIEHKHFKPYENVPNVTYITREYPSAENGDPCYPINNERNNELYQKYVELAQNCPNVIFGGRLGSYRYYDMDDVIESALELVQKEFGE